jgi:hypothetical protein
VLFADEEDSNEVKGYFITLNSYITADYFSLLSFVRIDYFAFVIDKVEGEMVFGDRAKGKAGCFFPIFGVKPRRCGTRLPCRSGCYIVDATFLIVLKRVDMA